jgi:hypothetical protein
MGIFLYIVAYLLFLPFTVFNALNVKKKGYFKDTAVNLDCFANREFRFSLNKYLITKEAIDRFGNIEETISSVLGKNKLKNNLTKKGINVCKFLDWLDKNHCVNSIRYKK